MKTLKIYKLIFFSFLLIIFTACDDDSNNSQQATSKVSVKLVDNPGDYENVFVEVVGVEVKFESDETENNWIPLEAINTGIIDLLELTGGVDVLLTDEYEIPSGTLKQVRLILGNDNTIVIDATTYPLNTPSAQQSGLKVQVDQYLEPNIGYTFILDFDIDQSIVISGNSGNINLVPVLRATIEANTGTISGTIIPSTVLTEVSTSFNGDVISTFTDNSGNFVLYGLEAGIYDIVITPDVNSTYTQQTITDVEVTVGDTTNLGEIILN